PSVPPHDEGPAAAAAGLDAGLAADHDAAAPLHEVRPVSCVARAADGTVLGGAIGRRWGACCELQQLWLRDDRRGRGLGRRVVLAFEAHAAALGCEQVILETFSFQAPAFYARLGYVVEFERTAYPHGLRTLFLKKRLTPTVVAT
ncbi:MAG: GNAT family N-acetyltransferase, partial [Betaproteobacteria bacterium]